MTYSLIALKPLTYAGRRIAVGQRFEIRSFGDAKVLKALGMAKDGEPHDASPPPQVKEPEPVQPEPVVESEPEPAEPVVEMTEAVEPEPEPAVVDTQEEDVVAFRVASALPSEPEFTTQTEPAEPPKRRRYRSRREPQAE